MWINIKQIINVTGKIYIVTAHIMAVHKQKKKVTWTLLKKPYLTVDNKTP